MSNKTIPADKLSNGVTLSVQGTTDETPIIINNVENINLPKQPYNTVEVSLVNASNGIKPRLLGGRSGGELTFKINVLDASDEGLIRVVAGYKGKEELTFYVNYPSGIVRTIPNCLISQCDPSDHSADSVIAYDCSVVVNGIMSESTEA